MNISVIIATYNQPEWLKKVLWGYENQDFKDFEIIIADDGSGDDTSHAIKQLKSETTLDIRHIWHEDKGYRRQEILNKAILEARYDYLLFTDGDCIPRKDFLSVHHRHMQKGYYLSGGYCKLPMNTSLKLNKDDICSQRCFDVSWLRAYGLKGFSQKRKLSVKGKWARFLDFVTTAKPTFNNCNVSAWKNDIMEINGYDERMQYGGADREIGERLNNKGIKGKQIRHRAICLHLDHSRGYAKKELIKRNLEIRRVTRNNRKTWTGYGIKRQ